MSTQNICSNDELENIYNFALKNFVYLKLCACHVFALLLSADFYLILLSPGKNFHVFLSSADFFKSSFLKTLS